MRPSRGVLERARLLFSAVTLQRRYRYLDLMKSAARSAGHLHRRQYGLACASGCVTTSIPLFVSTEVSTVDTLRWLSFLATVRHWTRVAVLWMEAVIDVTTEVVRAVEPWARSHEDTSMKPFWTVVAGGRTAVGSDIIVSIGTLRSYSDVDAYLSLCRGNGDRNAASGNSSQHDTFKSTHKFASLIPSTHNPRMITLTASPIAPPMSTGSCAGIPVVVAPIIDTRIQGFLHLSQ